MIRYTLKCDKGHQFDSWFQSAGAYERLSERGMTECAVCGSTAVSKALMAPRLAVGEDAVAPTPEPVSEPQGATQTMSLAEPASPLEKAISKLRQEVEKNSDYVGTSFASEARRMHEGETPTRAIYGEARPEEARALVDDGVPVMPLPFGRRDKA
ncbi:MAG: DUF1178 family protein, partial [Dinoroseobacter sp.]|nr:DUF1178 family protein [Dinoroseobacter sp.]